MLKNRKKSEKNRKKSEKKIRKNRKKSLKKNQLYLYICTCHILPIFDQSWKIEKYF